jgi:S1-C subfamily serine protease
MRKPKAFAFDRRSTMTINRKCVRNGSLIVVAALAGLGWLSWGASIDRACAGDPPKAKSHEDAIATANALSEAFAGAAEAIHPSVVSIRAVKHAKTIKPSSENQPPSQDLPNGLPFDSETLRRFFGGRIPEMTIPQQQGIGSGVIVDKDGYILTNNHVV